MNMHMNTHRCIRKKFQYDVSSRPVKLVNYAMFHAVVQRVKVFFRNDPGDYLARCFDAVWLLSATFCDVEELLANVFFLRWLFVSDVSNHNDNPYFISSSSKRPIKPWSSLAIRIFFRQVLFLYLWSLTE